LTVTVSLTVVSNFSC